MHHILIIEDEPVATQKIVRLLKERRERLEVSSAASGPEALRAIRAASPDLLFLDVEMPGFDGVELLARIEPRPFQVIFQTAHSQFALSAFEAGACDYLLKPFSGERFHQAVDRAMARLQESSANFLQSVLAKRGSTAFSIPAAEIVSVTSRHHHTYVSANGRELIYDATLTQLEGKLDPKRFVRIHRHCIVNRECIRRIERSATGRTVVLSDGSRFPLARRRSRKCRDLTNSR